MARRLFQLAGVAFLVAGCGGDGSDDDGVDAAAVATTGVSMEDLAEAIADHASEAAAHHEKTTRADEIVSGTLAPERLPAIDSSMVASSETDGSDLPHGCAWARSSDTANTATRSVTCPAGKHPISGACASPSLAISVVFSQPVDGGTVVDDGELVTDADGWSCLFTAASTGHVARALCCNY